MRHYLKRSSIITKKKDAKCKAWNEHMYNSISTAIFLHLAQSTCPYTLSYWVIRLPSLGPWGPFSDQSYVYALMTRAPRDTLWYQEPRSWDKSLVLVNNSHVLLHVHAEEMYLLIHGAVIVRDHPSQIHLNIIIHVLMDMFSCLTK